MAAPRQEQQPGLLPCGGSGQHHTDQPDEEGSIEHVSDLVKLIIKILAFDSGGKGR